MSPSALRGMNVILFITDQERAIQGAEPLDTLSSFRKGEGGVLFGQNLVHHGTGTLIKGTELEILE